MVGENNTAARTQVVLGARVGNQVVIEQGLDIGEKIVVQGIVNMRNGVTVAELGSDGRPNIAKSQQEANK